MNTELLAHSPLLALPLGAMFLFLTVWVATSLRALTRPEAEVDEAARLPLEQSMSGDNKFHVYDDIVEHDNKLPLWWQLTLYGTVLFGLVYWYGRRIEAIASPAQAYAAEVAAERAEAAERARARGTVDDAMLTTLSRDPASVARGKGTFATTCTPCHKVDGGGSIGPNLTDAYWLHGNKPTDLYKVVSEGIAAKGMPTWGPVLGEVKVEEVVAYVMTIENSNVAGGKAPQGELASR